MNLENTVSAADKGFIYSGRSMNPLFKNSDLLNIEPYGNKEIRVGDVIVYCPPDENKTIVHRVVSIVDSDIKTRGDNNWNLDDYTLKESDIKGHVDFIRRGKRRVRVFGGGAGYLISNLLKAVLLFKISISFLLRPMYRFFSKRNVFRIKPKILSYERPEGNEFQMLFGRFLIGRRRATGKRWWILPPFKLFIDERTLP